MKNELYQYAISIEKRSNGRVKPISGFGQYFALLFLSIGMLVTNVFIWIISLMLYGAVIFYKSREEDEYARALFDMGTFLMLICIYIAWIPIHFDFANEVVISIVISLLLYELWFYLNIKLKKYSSCVKKFKKSPILASGGVLTGVGIANSIKRNTDNASLSFCLIIISVVFFIFSITFIQRYLIYKILKNKYK